MSRRDTALRFFLEQTGETAMRVETGIELNRKGNAHIKLTSGSGSLPEGLTVEIEQVSHEFRFGANLFMLDEFETAEKNRIYRERFPEIFNLATLPFYWNDLEPEEGHPRFAADSPKVYRRPAPDLCVAYCREKGIEPKCHCLNYDSFIPEWARYRTVREQKALLDRRFREIAERYADSIPSFEVTNETLGYAKSAFYYEDDFVEWSFKTADRYFPKNRLIINDFDIWFPGSIWFPGAFNPRQAYYMQIERLLRNGTVHLDSIGLQFHSFFPLEKEEEMAGQRYNPETLLRLMDLYSRFGRAEQITEMTIPAYSGDAEDEEIQAELLRNLYTVFFSHPAMEAVIYWNLVDGYAAYAPQGDMSAGENRYRGGLLRFDMSEKPAYRELRNLITKTWHTSCVLKPQGASLDFRGFYGDYLLTFRWNGGEMTAPYRLSKHAANSPIVSLP